MWAGEGSGGGLPPGAGGRTVGGRDALGVGAGRGEWGWGLDEAERADHRGGREVQDAHVQPTGGDPAPKLVHFLW